MADHRDRDEDAPVAGNGQGAPEPEFGSSEWLLQQLSGGRLSGDSTRGEDAAADSDAIADADAAEPSPGPRRSNWVEPPSSTTPLVMPPSAEPQVGEPWVGEPQVAEPQVAEPQVQEPEAPAPEAPTPEGPAASTGAVPVFEPGAPFSWHLTPGVGADPLVQPEGQPDERLGEPETPPTTVFPVLSDSPAGAGPPVAEPPASAPFQAPSFADTIRIPEPPSWDVLLSGAAAEELRESADTPTPNEEQGEPTSPSSWNPFAAAPSDVEPRQEPADQAEPQPPVVLVPPVFPPAMDIPPPVSAASVDQPEEPQPEEPPSEEPPAEQAEQPSAEPVAGDTTAHDSHGLASLLGFFNGAPEGDRPSSHSVIGDTTGVVIVPDASLAPPSKEPTPVEPAPVTAPPPPAVPPVIPIPAGSFFEPSSPPPSPPVPSPPDAVPASLADVPTTQLDAAEIAALLNARTDDPQPDEYPSSAPETAVSVPPLEEATLLMGALPSPATQPLDAESLAEATDAPAPAPAEDAGTAPDESTDETGTANAEEDGLASLFGPEAADAEVAGPDGAEQDAAEHDTERDAATALATPDAATALFAQSVPPTVPLSAPSVADAILFPEFAAAATEVPPASAAGIASPAASTASGAAVPPTSAFPVPVPGGPGAPGRPAAPSGPSGPSGPGGAGGPGGPGRSAGLGGSPNVNRLLFWVAGGLAVVLVLIGLFALGTRLPALFGGAGPALLSGASASPSATPTPTPTPTPTVQPKPAGPQPAGTHPWNTLGGGECIQPFTTPWAETFTVVDCAAPHAAQMVYTNLFSADPAAPYPGADALAQQINLLCTKPGVIDLAAAGAYPDLQLQGTYPATDKQWKDGQRSYYCFASRASGQPLTSSVAGPGPAA